MYYIVALLTAGVSVAVVFFGIRAVQKLVASSAASGRAQQIKAIESITSELESILAYQEAYASSGQRDALANQLQEVKGSIEAQKRALKEVEDTLGKSQKQVEDKEASQQELKTVKEEDEKKLEEVLASYEQMQSESMALEQELAQSMKNLEEMMQSTDYTDEQKGLMKELDDAVATAGGRLRDLITEYEVVKERLETLKAQHQDLEDEYTRLVEQQLGA